MDQPRNVRGRRARLSSAPPLPYPVRDRRASASALPLGLLILLSAALTATEAVTAVTAAGRHAQEGPGQLRPEVPELPLVRELPLVDADASPEPYARQLP